MLLNMIKVDIINSGIFFQIHLQCKMECKQKNYRKKPSIRKVRFYTSIQVNFIIQEYLKDRIKIILEVVQGESQRGICVCVTYKNLKQVKFQNPKILIDDSFHSLSPTFGWSFFLFSFSERKQTHQGETLYFSYQTHKLRKGISKLKLE